MTSILITGGTRGLGLAAAQRSAARGAYVLVAGRSPESAGRVAHEVGGAPIVLDLEDLAGVAQCAFELPHIDVVALNAGLQIVTGATRTPDGFEVTFQVNHLAQLLLLDRLMARPSPPTRVVFTGSGAHDPARRSGMPAPLEGSVESWARAGDGDEPPATAGRRRYTTSKLLNTATAAALARERPDVHITCFDPGLMLGTGLSRQYPPIARRFTTFFAPLLALAPIASTPQRSGVALSRLLYDEPSPAKSGAYLDYHLHTQTASTQARNHTFQDTALHDSRQLLTPWSPPQP